MTSLSLSCPSWSKDCPRGIILSWNLHTALMNWEISRRRLQNLLHKRHLLLLTALANFLLVFFNAMRLLTSSRSMRLSSTTMGMLSQVGTVDLFSGGPDSVFGTPGTFVADRSLMFFIVEGSSCKSLFDRSWFWFHLVIFDAIWRKIPPAYKFFAK